MAGTFSQALYDLALDMLENGDDVLLGIIFDGATDKLAKGGGEYKIITSRAFGGKSAGQEVIYDALTSYTSISKAKKDWAIAETGVLPQDQDITKFDFSGGLR